MSRRVGASPTPPPSAARASRRGHGASRLVHVLPRWSDRRDPLTGHAPSLPAQLAHPPPCPEALRLTCPQRAPCNESFPVAAAPRPAATAAATSAASTRDTGGKACLAPRRAVASGFRGPRTQRRGRAASVLGAASVALVLARGPWLGLASRFSNRVRSAVAEQRSRGHVRWHAVKPACGAFPRGRASLRRLPAPPPCPRSLRAWPSRPLCRSVDGSTRDGEPRAGPGRRGRVGGSLRAGRLRVGATYGRSLFS